MARPRIAPHLIRRPGRLCWYAYMGNGRTISLGTDDRTAAQAVLDAEVKRRLEKPPGRPPSRRPKWNTVRQRVRRKGVRLGAACEVCGWTGPLPMSTLLNAHHVIPLGCDGVDAEHNIILLCPNHHAVTHAAWKTASRRYLGPATREALVSALRAIDLGVCAQKCAPPESKP